MPPLRWRRPRDAVDLNVIVGIATLVAVLTGLAFGVTQIRQAERKRRDAAAMELVHTLQGPEFRAAFLCIWSLPRGLSADEVRAAGKEVEEAATVILWAFEALGVMVFQRVIPMATVDHLIGGVVRDSWQKLGPYVAARRLEIGSPNVGEWFQWLAERLEVNPVPGKAQGAYVTHRAWGP